MRPVARLVLALALATLSPVVVAFAADGRVVAPEALLPDLLQRAPNGAFTTEPSPGDFELAFPSSVENVGDGPLSLEASRPSTATPWMTAAQVISNADGSTTEVDRVGRLHYVRSPDHSHWHYLDFERYTLRKLGHGLIGHDHKTGFCLGNRYAIGDGLSAPYSVPGWSVDCGAGHPELLKVREGISVGFGDDYGAALEGQTIEITGLPAGRYRLVHRVNASRRLHETNYSNDVATAVVKIGWPAGHSQAPTARVVATCEGAPRC